jgi:Zn-dependent M16 (insulinase) family peptidase
MNNCFSVIVKTPPTNNKGIPLVVERMIMNGSKKYPIRDPLSHMASQRSYN